MVIVLCENYREARNAYLAWLAFLYSLPSDVVAFVNRHALRVETNDGSCYIFMDYRYEKVFLEANTQKISIIDFFGIERAEAIQNLT